MKPHRPCLCLFVVALLVGHGHAHDIQLRLRTHANSVRFGDPIYLELTVENRGDEIVYGAPPLFDGDHLRYELQDPEAGLFIWQVNANGQATTNTFLPKTTTLFYQYLFVPKGYNLDHPFWKPIQRGQSISLKAVYPLAENGLQLTSVWQHVVIARPRNRQIAALKEWKPTGKVEIWEPGPKGADYGLLILAPLVRWQVIEARKVFQTGEIADLLQLTLMLQDLHAMKPDQRDEANQKLVLWLRQQVDIKRQALALQTRMLAASYQMTSTQQALEKLIADPDFMGKAANVKKDTK